MNSFNNCQVGAFSVIQLCSDAVMQSVVLQLSYIVIRLSYDCHTLSYDCHTLSYIVIRLSYDCHTLSYIVESFSISPFLHFSLSLRL
jgi:hypothetical protein